MFRLPCVVILPVMLGLASGASGEERAGLDWWSFQPVTRPAVPGEKGERSNPIDGFVRARLAKAGMEAAPPADAATLVRRLHHVLTGLPPSAEELASFAEDSPEERYERKVDALLASPRFGERWARHWLDVVRYAETIGYERDAVKPNIWKYRDWVIRAFNEDLPYDQFVRAQVAGDELAKRSEQSVIATGMLRAGTWNDEPNDPQEYKYERLEDMVDVVSTAFLGVTVKCARCHDHKFDPIPQRDYYRLAAAFWPGAIEPRSGALMGGPNEEELGFKGVFGWTDIRKDPPPLHLLENGEVHRKGPVVEPGLLSLVPALDRPLRAAAPGARTTGRRAQWAEFIVDRKNPLTARVMVNRVWQHLFGEGIVRTPNNFGLKAAPPTHPELLDWLAAEFMDEGWRIKPLIREIVLSRTFRQSSVHPRQGEFAERDSSNTLLWKQNRRRRDAESLRDAMLDASGELNLRMGGPSFYPLMAAEVLEGFSRKGSAWTPSGPEDRRRRSIYMVSKRHLLLPLMTAFDFPNSEKPCGQRDVTTVAPQALALMNNQFVHARSEALAGFLRRAGKEGEAESVRDAWRRVLGRAPGVEELDRSLQHYHRQRSWFQSGGGTAGKAGRVTRLPETGRVLWLTAERGVELEGDRVAVWRNPSSGEAAVQEESIRRPRLAAEAIGGRPALRFSGRREFLHLPRDVVRSQANTVIAVARDRGEATAHRGIFSNWNAKGGNSTTSLFLGLTGKGAVRFSDDFRSTQEIDRPGEAFVLAASTGRLGTRIMHNAALIGARPAALTTRNLRGDYVIGQQGNIDGEYWTGDLSELVVFDRQLADAELRAVSAFLAEKYAIALAEESRESERTPEFLALASLCHVLLNTNEFLYVD
ncbi:MAG: hypothetical protein CMP28_07335 [Roseibacillus sp.]|nr:hypothetical protein [Roseibacillus sp.]